MNNDTLNATAQWNIFDANVTVMKESVCVVIYSVTQKTKQCSQLVGFDIPGKDDYILYLRTIVINGKTYLETQANLLKTGNDLATVLLRTRNQQADALRLQRSLAKAQDNNALAVILKRAMFDRLLDLRTLVFLDFFNYSSAYVYHTLTSGES